MAYKPGIDLPAWRQLSNPVAGTSLITPSVGWWAEDLRNNGFADQNVYFYQSAASIYAYNKSQTGLNDGWFIILSAGFGGAGSAGAGAVFKSVPSLSPTGTLAAGGTTTSVVLSTALPASIGTNQAKGYRVRIIGNAILGNGKVEERTIISNTSGTTPTLVFDPSEPLSTAPVAGDRYEFLTGSVVFLGTGASATAAIFRRYDILTGAVSSLGTTGCIATIPATGNIWEPTDEGFVPANRKCYEGCIIGASTYDVLNVLTGGVKGCLTATGTAATTIIGQAINGDAAVVANQFRNYQIRIVEDTLAPTAVGQRRRIISHTGGASPVYTISSGATNWTVTPSGSVTFCKFVIEPWTDNIIARFGGSATTYNYTLTNNYTGVNTADQWNTTTWAASGSAAQTSGAFGCFAHGLVDDAFHNINPGQFFMIRGSTATRIYDVLDITGAATGAWTNGLVMIGAEGAITSSDQLCSAYNPHTQEGRYLYFFPSSNASTTTNQRPFARFDCANRHLEYFFGIPGVTGSSAFSSRFAWISLYQSATEKVAYYNTGRPLSGTEFFQIELSA